MTYFDRARVSPSDVVWDQPAPAEQGKGPPPLWSALTHPVLAPPAGARPFYLSGNISSQVVPFVNAQVPACELQINIGDVCVLKNLYIAFDVTFNPTAGRFWSLNVDGTPIGNGFGAAYQFGTGWTTTNGLVWMPLDVRLTVTGLLTLNVTDTVGAGPVRTFAGILQGWLYPARFDAGLETT